MQQTPIRIQIETRPGQPPDRVRTWFPALAFITAWRRNDRFGPTALPLSRATSAAFAEASCRFVILRWTNLRLLRWPAVLPASCSEEQQARWGRRPQRPGNQSRLRAFLEYPPAIHPRESPAPLALPQSFGKLRNSHVSLNPLSARLLRPATQKTCAVVQNLWRMRLPCGRLRKTKNEYLPPDSRRS